MPDQRQYAGYSIKELPKVNTDDEGKVLAVVKGKWDKSGSQIELPVVSSDDNGKVLGVTEGAWNKMDAPTELPAVTASDNGRILQVSNGEWTKQNMPTELPAVTASDNGKVLGVVEGNWGLTGVPDENSFIICTRYDSASDKYYTDITRDDIVEALKNNRSIYLYHDDDRYIYQFVGISAGPNPSSAAASKFAYPVFTWFGALPTGIQVRTIKLNKTATQIDSVRNVDIDSEYGESDIGKIMCVNNGGYPVPNTIRFTIESTEQRGSTSGVWNVNKTWTQIKNAWITGYNIYLCTPDEYIGYLGWHIMLPVSKVIPNSDSNDPSIPNYNDPYTIYFQCHGKTATEYDKNVYSFKLTKDTDSDDAILRVESVITPS